MSEYYWFHRHNLNDAGCEPGDGRDGQLEIHPKVKAESNDEAELKAREAFNSDVYSGNWSFSGICAAEKIEALIASLPEVRAREMRSRIESFG